MVDGDGALRSDLILKEIGISANIPIKSHFRSKGRYEDAEIKLHFTSTQLEPLIGGWWVHGGDVASKNHSFCSSSI